MGHINKRALLINPPIYDVQYWAEWSQPQGLLKIGTLLKNHGYETFLIDCLYPNQKRNVPKKIKSVVEIGSTPLEISLNDFRKIQSRLKQNQRYKYIFGINLDDLRKELLALVGLTEVDEGKKILARSLNIFPEESFHPDEIWITSIMTYWWESTVDVAVLCKEIFPSALIRIGGIYPTLAPNHLANKLSERGLDFEVIFGYLFDLSIDRDAVVVGEIPEASWLDLDLDLYYQPHVRNSRYYHGPIAADPGHETTVVDRRFYGPSYAILTTTRGCPFNCAYCAQHAYNLYDNKEIKELLWTDERGRKKAVRTRGSEITLNEIRDKFHRYGIRQFAFYEDNFLIEKDHFKEILNGIVNDLDLHGNIHLHAPEGIEVRLIDDTLADLMYKSGFERVYLPLENINTEVIKSWNRSHSNVQMFERAVQNCVEAGFRLRNMEVNAFILFGTPGEDIRDVVDSAIYASSRIGSVIPMLFTPVPGSAIFEEYRSYLFNDMEFDLQHLNGKLFPFLEFNRRQNPELMLGDYLNLEAFMFRLNAQALRGTFDIGGDSRVSRALRKVIIAS
jgi:radical SAM superfamily enzyme YgiQ (UPF0313 family)